MKSLCVTGLLSSKNDAVLQILRDAGTMAARPVLRDATLDMATWHARVLASREQDGNPILEPGRLWEQLAGDLFLANMDAPAWGWADSRSMPLLDFWVQFDASISFVLVSVSASQFMGDVIAQQDGEIDTASLLAQWTESQQELLRFHLRNPLRSILVSADDVLAAPRAFVDTCANRWSLPLTGAHCSPVITQEFDNLSRYLAAQLADGPAEQRHLQYELDAAMLRFSEAETTVIPGVAVIVEEFRALRAGQHLKVEHEAALEQERSARARAEQREADLAQRHAQLTDQLAAAKKDQAEAAHTHAAETRRLHALHKEAQQEEQHLVRQFQHVQEALAQTTNDLHASRKSSDARALEAKALLDNEQQLRAAAEQASAAVKDENTALSSQNTTLRANLERSETMLASAKQRVEQIEQALALSIADMEALRTRSETRIGDLENGLSNERLKRERAEEQGAAAVEQQLQLQSELSAIRADLNSSQSSLAAESDRLAQAEQALAQANEAIDALQEESIARQAEFEQALAHAKTEIDTLQADAAVRQVESEQLQMQAKAEADTLRQDAAERLKAFEEAQARSSAEIDALRSKAQTQLQEIETAKAQSIADAEANQVRNAAQVAELEEALIQAVAENDELRSRAQQLADDLTAAVKAEQLRRENAEQQGAGLANEVAALRVELEQSRRELAQSTAAQARERERAVAAQQTLVLANSDIEALRGRVQTQESELEAALNSERLWREKVEQQLAVPAVDPKLIEQLAALRSELDANTAAHAAELKRLQALRKEAEQDNLHLTQQFRKLQDDSERNSVRQKQKLYASLRRNWARQSQIEQAREHLLLLQAEQESMAPQLRTAQIRIARLLQRIPGQVDFGAITFAPASSEPGDVLQCRISELHFSGNVIDQIEFVLIVEGGIAGLSLLRDAAGRHPLIRWPLAAQERDRIDIIPAGHPTDAKLRAEILSQLASGDCLLVETLFKVLASATELDDALPQSSALSAGDVRDAIARSQSILARFPPILRFDTVSLERAYTDPGYEHLQLAISNMSFNGKPGTDFQFRVACAKVPSEHFGDHPRLEFPPGADQILQTWFAESENIHGPKLELRFALPDAMDMQVWIRLSQGDQLFVRALTEVLPIMLAALSKQGVQLARPWMDWLDLASSMLRILRKRTLVERTPKSTAVEPESVPAPPDDALIPAELEPALEPVPLEYVVVASTPKRAVRRPVPKPVVVPPPPKPGLRKTAHKPVEAAPALNKSPLKIALKAAPEAAPKRVPVKRASAATPDVRASTSTAKKAKKGKN